ncbi:MAG: hypothetical protein HRU26_08930 [Psychroserpens sp.]|nr:hypothetical protein [Psychroserpens sp.]
MAIPAKPAVTLDWATQTLLNSPTNTANKDYLGEDVRYQSQGWAYAEFPPYQVFNEYQNRVGRWNDWVQLAIEDLDDRVGGGNTVSTITVQTLTSPYTITLPTGVAEGHRATWVLTQDSLGGRSITIPADMTIHNLDGVLLTTADTTNFINAVFDGTTWNAEVTNSETAETSVELQDRTITIESGSTYQDIQDAFDSIGRFIDKGVIITVIFEDDIYDIGANVITIRGYHGGGSIFVKCENGSETGANATSKNVTIRGTGAQGYNEFSPYSDQAGSRFLVQALGCDYVVFGDIHFEMDPSGATVASACVSSSNSNVSVHRCVMTNKTVTGVYVYGTVGYNSGSMSSADTHYVISDSSAVNTATGTLAGGICIVGNASGSADYNAYAFQGTVYASGTTVSARVSNSLTNDGQVI